MGVACHYSEETNENIHEGGGKGAKKKKKGIATETKKTKKKVRKYDSEGEKDGELATQERTVRKKKLRPNSDVQKTYDGKSPARTTHPPQAQKRDTHYTK